MKHYGDITQLLGSEVPIVDIVTGGSPCQNLSVAGNRKGLEGTESRLFLEQIRLIREMRENDKASGKANEFIRPRWMVWENVGGALTSNKGEDFRTVLEETAKIADKDTIIPRPPQDKNGKLKWSPSGCIMGDGWSIAWRVHDAQFWGVPQRRKRIALVADFGGSTAPEILFERKGLSGDIKTECGEREETALSIRGSADKAVAIYDVRISSSGTKNWRAHCYETDISRTLDSGGENPDSNHGGLAIVCEDKESAIVLENHPSDSRVKYSKDNIVQTLSSRMGTGGGNVPLIMEQPYTSSKASFHQKFTHTGKAETLVASDYKDPPIVIYKQEDIPQGVDVYNGASTGDVAASLTAACGGSNTSGAKVLDNGYIVRRLTPLECERLQGFEDGWTDIGDWVDAKGRTHKGTSDSPRYKALGNSIALPFWRWMAKRMVRYITNHQPTMASLFDGICGFPVVFSEVGCKPIWASEVEPFCIEVSKIRFPE